jgi:hypothetical protein
MQFPGIMWDTDMETGWALNSKYSRKLVVTQVVWDTSETFAFFSLPTVHL